MRKVTSLLLLLSMLFFISCSATENTKTPDQTTTAATTTKAVTTTAAQTTAAQSTTTNAETTTEANPFAKHLELTYLVRFTDKYDEVRWDELELEEKFNIDIQVWTIDAYNAEQCTMMAAAGDWADTGYVNGYDPYRAYDEGLTRNISLEQIRNMLPEYYAILESNPIGFKVNHVEDEPGHYYGLSFCYAQNNYWYHVNCFRLDWLENVGYAIDDLTEVRITAESFQQCAEGVVFLSNHIFSYEEYLDILRAFTEDDPDGNGNDDTYGAMWPLTGPSYGSHWTDIYTGMFGITQSYTTWLYYDEISGNYVPSYAHPGWRDFLIFINDMLTKGYMKYMVDIAGGDYAGNFYGAVLTGAYGHFPLDTWFNMNPGSPVRIENGIPQGIQKVHPDARFVVVPAIVGPDGIGGNKRYVDLPFRDGAYGTWTFGHGCTDEKLERALALLRYTHFTDEGFYRYYYGIEGIHYTWSGEPYNSAVILTDASKIPRKYANSAIQAIFATDKFLMDFKKWSMVSEWFMQLCDFQVQNGWYMKYTLEPDKLISRLYMGNEMYDEYIELRNNVNSDIMTIANDFRNKAFNGELADIYAEWGNYIDALYRAGLEQYVEIFNRPEFGLYNIDKSTLYY